MKLCSCDNLHTTPPLKREEEVLLPLPPLWLHTWIVDRKHFFEWKQPDNFWNSLFCIAKGFHFKRLYLVAASIRILQDYNIRKVCQQVSIYDKRPFIKITFFCKNINTTITDHLTQSLDIGCYSVCLKLPVDQYFKNFLIFPQSYNKILEKLNLKEGKQGDVRSGNWQGQNIRLNREFV